uniref:Uncharacterized protein n=1 Tax=Takifugu rubripes TaxID=31033 RepID=A0A674MEP6_TAKRU
MIGILCVKKKNASTPGTKGEQSEITDRVRWKKPTNASRNQQFSQEQQKVRHLIQHSHPTGQRQRNHPSGRGSDTNSEEEGVLGRGAEVLSVYLFQAPEAAFEAAESAGLFLQDQGTKSKRTSVVTWRSAFIPYGSAKRGVERAGGDVVWLLQGPVIGSKGPSQGALAQRDGKVDQPEKHKQVAEMEHQDIAMVNALPPVEGEHAL